MRIASHQADVAGCSSGIELMVRFVDFCDARTLSSETVGDITTKFRVSKATAYRWIRAYCNARGIPTLDTKRRRS